jgi:hypothetical protein
VDYPTTLTPSGVQVQLQVHWQLQVELEVFEPEAQTLKSYIVRFNLLLTAPQCPAAKRVRQRREEKRNLD